MRCLNMQTGIWLHLPLPGGIFDQDDLLLSHVNLAWRTWFIHEVKTANDHTDEDVEFTRKWVLEPGFKPV